MPVLNDEELKELGEPTTVEVVPNFVARYWDLMALADKSPAKVLGEHGKLRDKPGFEIDFITRGSAPETMHAHEKHSVLMPMRGHWRLDYDGGSAVLNPGDTAAIPPNLKHSLSPAMTGEASIYRIVATDDEAGLTTHF
jgi:mannose-6-phosphate isomerase-like protein (cupin superfamily)